MPPDRSARPLVGRTRELAFLTEEIGLDGGLARARGLLVAGDAGVGKTRTVGELLRRAQAAGRRTLVGHCLDFADNLLPYLPFTELVGRLADEEPQTARRLVGAHPALAALAPGRRMLSGPAPAGTEPRERPAAGSSHDSDRDLGPDLDRGDLFASVQAALDDLAQERPLLVVVEDTHWADRSTRDLLSFLFARPFRGQVTVLVTYRSDDLHRRHPLRATAAEWVRMPDVERLQLAPLPDADVGRIVRAVAPAPLRERDLQAIVDRAEGNAFYAEELAAMTGGALPVDLADLLLVRLDGLDEDARQVVRAASCAGRRVSHALLATVAGLPTDRLERALRAAVDAHVLVQVAADGYAFRHALLAEAVYDDLLPGERVRLHASYTAALRDRVVDGTAAELATHARAAGDVETALRAGIEAGEDAMAVGGPDDAARHFESALALAGEPGLLDPGALVALVVQTSDAVTASGHPTRALAIVRDALGWLLGRLPGGVPAPERARLLMTLATCLMLTESQEDPAHTTFQALDLLDDEPTPLRARLLGVHARALTHEGREDEAVAVASESLALAQKLNLPAVVADATVTLADLDDRAGDADQARTALERVVAEAAAAQDTAATMRGEYLLGHLHLERSELGAAQDAFHRAAAAADEAGRPWAPYGMDARVLEAVMAYQRGRFDDALRIADVSGQSPPPEPEALMASVAMLVRAARGDRSAVDLLATVRPSWEREGISALNSAAAAIDLHGDAGEVDAAVTVHDEAVRTLSRIWGPAFQAGVRLSALLLGQLATAAGTTAAAERPGLARRAPALVGAVDAVLRQVEARRRPFGAEGMAWVRRARAEEQRLRWAAGLDPPAEEALVEAWAETVAGFAAMGHVFEEARSRVRLGTVLRAAGRAAEAREHLDAARDTARRLGARPLLAELGDAGSRPGPGERVADTLTPREAEILALVAEGRSNAEIGRRLYISAKTVSVHVSNILAKLGAAGRTEAAAIARRRGLLD